MPQEVKRNGSTEFEIPFNRTDMANYLDADRSALTRELARMKDCGLIDFDKRNFKILKFE